MRLPALAFAAILAASSPALAQEAALSEDGQGIETAVGAYAGLTNDRRRELVVSQLTAAGHAPELAPFEGGNDRTGRRAGANVVVTVGEGARTSC